MTGLTLKKEKALPLSAISNAGKILLTPNEKIVGFVRATDVPAYDYAYFCFTNHNIYCRLVEKERKELANKNL